MTQKSKASKSLKITTVSVADAAKALASSYGRQVTEAQVREIAERGGLLHGGGGDTINLIEYVVFLVKEAAHGQGND